MSGVIPFETRYAPEGLSTVFCIAPRQLNFLRKLSWMLGAKSEKLMLSRRSRFPAARWWTSAVSRYSCS